MMLLENIAYPTLIQIETINFLKKQQQESMK